MHSLIVIQWDVHRLQCKVEVALKVALILKTSFIVWMPFKSKAVMADCAIDNANYYIERQLMTVNTFDTCLLIVWKIGFVMIKICEIASKQKINWKAFKLYNVTVFFSVCILLQASHPLLTNKLTINQTPLSEPGAFGTPWSPGQLSTCMTAADPSTVMIEMCVLWLGLTSNFFFIIEKEMITPRTEDNVSRKDGPWAGLIRAHDQYYII